MQGWMIFLNVLTVLIAILLIVGGAKLMKRQAQCRMMLLSWAALKILLAVIGSVLGYFSLLDQIAAVEKSGTATPAMSQSATQLMGLFSMGFGFLWAIAGAVFIIIWFKREKIRSEVSSWM
jgi:TRAP-type C4-dicarboxylate transport system permease small subunit